MKYNININQKKSVEWELSTSEAIVFSWIYSLPSWSNSITYNNEAYYFGSRNKACEELPIVTSKFDTMYRIFKSLSDKSLISIISLEKKDYIALTDKGREWYDGIISTIGSKNLEENSEKNPCLGKKSKETRKKIRINSEKNPIYNNISNNNTSNNRESVEAKASTIELRKEKFGESLIPFVEKYGKAMIRAFFDYWTEPNRSQTKMRFELQKTWETSRRLATWASRETFLKTKTDSGIILTDNSVEKFKSKSKWDR